MSEFALYTFYMGCGEKECFPIEIFCPRLQNNIEKWLCGLIFIIFSQEFPQKRKCLIPFPRTGTGTLAFKFEVCIMIFVFF